MQSYHVKAVKITTSETQLYQNIALHMVKSVTRRACNNDHYQWAVVAIPGTLLAGLKMPSEMSLERGLNFPLLFYWQLWQISIC